MGAGQKGGECGGEGDVAADRQADRRRHQLLFGDEHLEIAFGIDLGELLGVGGVAHFAIKGDHIGTGADRGSAWPNASRVAPWRPGRNGAV